MKKTIIKLAIASMATLVLFSCNPETSGEEKNPETPSTEEAKYEIDAETISLKWTAFKTTDKKPVGGTFTTINVNKNPSADAIEKAIHGVSFSVPVTGISSNNETRDAKLVRNFFNIMDDTEFIKGTFSFDEGNAEKGTGVLDLIMNGKECDLPYDYTISNDSLFITTILNLNEWNSQNALDSLNVACGVLHKGPDGISKTWTEVEIKASVALVKK